MRVLVIGAHPDDCEIRCGGTTALLTKAGHTVKFVSATNGEKGHHRESGTGLISRRREEARAGAAVLGADSLVLENPDGEIQADLDTRWQFIRVIREFSPDILITHRPWDYHPDHRIVGQLVQDCSYLVRVPLICPDSPVPAHAPVILLMYDGFSKPLSFSPSLVVDIDSVADSKLQALHRHTSQVYEWLPWIEGVQNVPEDDAGRLTYLKEWLGSRDEAVTTIARPFLVQQYGAHGHAVQCAEAFEMSEYGRRVSPIDLHRQLGLS